MYVAMQATHNPYEAPDSYSKGYEAINSSCTPENQNQCTTRYKFAGMATGLDQAIKNITNAFKKYGLWDDTVLIFTSDNGAECGIGSGNNYPLRGGKVTNWEGGIRANAFVRGTNSKIAPLPQNEITNELMHSTDWFLTVCHIAGIECKVKLPLDGFDQWPILEKKKLHTERTFIWHNVPNPNNSTPVARPTLSGGALRIGDWKFLFEGRESGENTKQYPPPGFKPSTNNTVPKPYNGTYWLFNITNDPTESINLAEPHMDILQVMIMKYNEILASKAYVPDLVTIWGFKDPNGNPMLREDKTWGPWINQSSCAYGREFQPLEKIPMEGDAESQIIA